MVCRTVCLALLMVVGAARLPGNPLPDGWSDADARAVPYDEVAGRLAVPALLTVLPVCGQAPRRHGRVRRRALAGLPDTEVAVLPDDAPCANAYALPGDRHDRAVVTTTLVVPGTGRAARAVHPRAGPSLRRAPPVAAGRPVGRALLRVLPTAVSYTAERP